MNKGIITIGNIVKKVLAKLFLVGVSVFTFILIQLMLLINVQ